jgi:hypothetical protein
MSYLSARRWLGQKLAAVERNWPHRVKNRVFGLPPIASGPRERKLVVLCEPRTFADGCWSAWSWMRWVHEDLALRLFVDGPVSPEGRARFGALFPGAEIASLPEFLARQPAPGAALGTFLGNYTYARKLSLLLALQREGDFLYADADVALFRRPDLILEAIRTPGAPGLFMQEPECWCVDPWVVETAQRLGLPRHNDLNSGLLWIPRGSLDTGLVERFLTDWKPQFHFRAAEQTLLSVLMAVNGAQGLPPREYVVSNEGMFFWIPDEIDYGRIVARHFVGNVRHLLYRTAMPLLLEESRREARNLQPSLS